MSEANKQVVRRLIEEVYNKGDFAAMDEVVSEDFVSHDPTAPEPVRGREGLRAYVEMLRTAFPNIHLRIDDMIAEGGKVAVRWTATGRHEGEMLGIPATGRDVQVTGQTIGRVEDGRSAEDWVSWDALGMLRQLGVVS
ncbi:MAG: ester cyclase [Actinomycetota bacterium]